MSAENQRTEIAHLLPIDDPAKPVPWEKFFNPNQPLELEIGCGNGRFLAARAQRNPNVGYLGIERLLGRVRKLDRKATRLGLDNLRILRLEAFYSLHYLIPYHRLRTVYVFFPDPWPKRHHHLHRLFSPLFLNALWAKLEIGGTIQIATDHLQYFEEIKSRFAEDPRFAPIPAMTRDEEEQTDFEQRFLSMGLPIGSCAYQSLPGDDIKLKPITIPPEMEPRDIPRPDRWQPPDDDD